MESRTKQFIAMLLVVFCFGWVTAYAVPAFYNSLFGPVEYFTTPSLFFRTATNPGQVIPVMASDGYRLPVDITMNTTSSSTISTTGTPTKMLPFTSYPFHIASNSYKTLRSIASFSTGNYVVTRAINVRLYQVGNTSVATSTAVWCNFIENGEQQGFFAATSTAGTWASAAYITTSNGSGVVVVWPAQN